MKTKIILIRHAHRDTSQRELDNGLSQKGKKQTKKATVTLKKLCKNRRAQIWTSPKKRCLETILPFCKDIHFEPIVSDLLDEGGALSAKVKILSSIIKRTRLPVLIFSSHGDLLPELIYEISGKPKDLKKSEIWVWTNNSKDNVTKIA